jgi:hypothetical protein
MWAACSANFESLMTAVNQVDTVASRESNKCSIEMFIKLALTFFFKRQQHRKLSWLDIDSDKDQSQFDELFNSNQ